MPTEPVLEELRTLTTELRRVRRRRYAAISDALAAGHTQRAVAASAGMSPAVLSRVIRQDIARPQGDRLLPGLRTGKVDGQPLRWFVASLPFDESGGSRS